MESFCGHKFWDKNLTWNTENPELTECFNKTVMVWTPPAFLLLFCPLFIFSITQNKQRIEWNFYNKFRQILSALQIIISICECVTVLVKYYQNDDLREAASLPDICAAFVRLISSISVFVLLWAQVIRGVHTSGVIWFYFLISVICGAPTLHGHIHWHPPPVYELILFCIQYVLAIFLFLFNCFADRLPPYKSRKTSKEYCAKESVSFLSRLLFSWFTPMTIKGWKKPLTSADLWEVRHQAKSSTLNSLFSKNQKVFAKKTIFNSSFDSHIIADKPLNGSENHTKKYKIKGQTKHGSIKSNETPEVGVLSAIVKTFWLYFLSGSAIKVIDDLLNFANPQIIKLLMAFISDKSEYEWHGYLYAVLLFIVTAIRILCSNFFFNRMFHMGIKIRTCLVAAVYRKSLRLSNSAKSESTTGEIVNLMAVDAQRFFDISWSINYVWSAPLQIALCVYFLWQEIGVSVLGGLAAMIIVMPINALLMGLSKRLQVKQMKFKDERVKIMSEILSGIKVIKLYGWEQAFMNQVLKIRDKEMNNLKIIKYFGGFIECLWSFTPFLVSFVSFAIFVLINPNNVLTAEKAFVSLALFNVLRFPISRIPIMVNHLILTSVSIKRLNKFLNSSELSGYVNKSFNEKYAITVSNASFNWKTNEENEDKSKSVGQSMLKDINVEIEKNSLVAIVGSVGSGKSSFLSSLLGDMEIQSGFVQICSSMKIAYVPQQAWIQNTSLKNNILFGQQTDPKLYQRVIDCCALKLDLDILPGGDETEIGEKGINLSGGQKQRVSLARACFSGADLFLFDDPLSAVDSHVGKHIFEEVMDSKTGLLKDKTRILVTNSLTFLPLTDKIIVLKDGKISETGTFKELMKTGDYFSELIKQYSANTLDKEEVTDDIEKKKKSGTVKETNTENSKLVEAEIAETGSVNISVYYRYFKAISWFWCIIIVIVYLLWQSSEIGSNIWLSKWSQSNDSGQQNTIFYLIIYGALGMAEALLVTFGWLALTVGVIKSSKYLHLKMLEQILHSPMSFFDTTPLGRILNRFSKDVDTCDSDIHFSISGVVSCALASIATIVVISIEVPIFLAVVVPLAFVFYLIQKFFISTQRQVKRLESITKSPIYAHFSETLSGVTTIRAYGVHEKFTNESDERVDQNNETVFCIISANRWLSIRIEMVANFLVFFSALFSVIYRNDMYASQVGLIVTYAMNSTSNLNWLVRVISELETNVVSVERILEYTDLKTEADWYIRETAPPIGWPVSGNIDFENYSTKYRTGLDLVIKQISLRIKSGEKIGIVGRTGAGKSSLTLALFRLIESTEGKIVIDGINISDIGLNQLRSRLTIIPQDPILFSGTIRSNLDPFNSYSDQQLWDALELSHLKSFIKSLDTGLEHKVSEGGENLSVGQRQLICLGRALLRNTKVLILDEATAAVDLETDSLIQTTIRKAFSDCTVLTIAHRLHTILDSNRVLVLNDGRIAEFDSPASLLSNEESIFYSLAKDAGIKS